MWTRGFNKRNPSVSSSTPNPAAAQNDVSSVTSSGARASSSIFGSTRKYNAPHYEFGGETRVPVAKADHRKPSTISVGSTDIGSQFSAHARDSSSATSAYFSGGSEGEEADREQQRRRREPSWEPVFERDPIPELQPRSKRMALGSITYSASQGEELGVLAKNNSFYLRVEKCEPAFYDRLNYEVEKLYGIDLPTNVPDPTLHWPEGALNQYCQRKNPKLEREMYRTYRHWHDSRCRMNELGTRLRRLHAGYGYSS